MRSRAGSNTGESSGSPSSERRTAAGWTSFSRSISADAASSAPNRSRSSSTTSGVAGPRSRSGRLRGGSDWPSSRLRAGNSSMGALLLDDVDHFEDSRDVLVLDECREPVHALRLRGVGVGAPAVVAGDVHVEEPERDDLVFVADVARVVCPLEPGRNVVSGVPRETELLPRSGLEPACGE